MNLTEAFIAWYVASILLYIIGGLCANDPGSTDLENKIFFSIIAILALPVTITGLILLGILILFMKKFIK